MDGHIPNDEYRRQKKRLEEKLRSLVGPDADVALQAGKLLEDLPRLWEKADLGERRCILMTMLDAVYVDAKEERRIVAIKPKSPFKAVFEVATMREGSGIVLVVEPPPEEKGRPVKTASAPCPPGGGADAVSCSWWRQGREPVSKSGKCFRLWRSG